MKHKMLLLILAAMLMAVAAHAAPIIGDNDTLWTKPMGGVSGVKFHPSGETVIVSREGNGLFELNAETGEYIRSFTHSLPLPSQDTYWDFDISSDGNYLFAVDYDYRCFLWNHNTGQLIRGFDQDGWFLKHVPNSDNFIIVKNNEERNLWVYNTLQDSVIRVELKEVGNRTGLTSLATSPDGRYFALASQYEYDGETKCNLAVFDASTFEKVVDVVNDEYGSIDEIEFSQNSKWIAYKIGIMREIINLYNFINEGEKNKIVINSLLLGFLDSENMIAFNSTYPKTQLNLFDLEKLDTLYQYNFGASYPLSVNQRHLMVTHGAYKVIDGFTQKLIMLNSNWYTLDVPNEPIDSEQITEANYINGTISYTTNLFQINTLTITDTIGTTIYSRNSYCPSQGLIEIALPRGVYFLTVNDGQNSYTRKFIVAN